MIYTTEKRYNARMRPFQTSRAAGNVAQDLVYASDGDANGLVYFYGTVFGTTSFTNPQTLGNLILTTTGVLGGSEEPLIAVTDRVAGHFYTTDATNSWIKFDLGLNGRLRLTKYSYRSRSSFAGDWPLQWILEGSNDDSSWTAIDTQNPVTPALSAVDQWRTFTPSAQTVFYRYFRWKQTGTNSGSNNKFVFGEAELYGTLIY